MIDTRSPTRFCANLGAVEDRSVNRDELPVEIDRAVIAPRRDHVTDHATGAQPSDACSSAAAETPARAHRPAKPLSRQLFLRLTFETVPPGSTGHGLTGAEDCLECGLFRDGILEQWIEACAVGLAQRDEAPRPTAPPARRSTTRWRTDTLSDRTKSLLGMWPASARRRRSHQPALPPCVLLTLRVRAGAAALRPAHMSITGTDPSRVNTLTTGESQIRVLGR